MTIHRVPTADLSEFAAQLFERHGVPSEAARYVANCLVLADREGVPSHGTMLVPMYLSRITSGSVDPVSSGRVVSRKAGATVIDAENGLGQITSRVAIDIALEGAREHGVASVAVRRGFHFGTAGHWAAELARSGCIGIAVSNTRPLMPGIGGTEPLVGNNPLAIAVPSGDEPIVLDMALSAAAMGKIRIAAASGKSIPGDWATDRDGIPTTDPTAAITGMLLPAAGPKGFGLALMLDILAGGLSSGGIGPEVSALYGNLEQPYNCSHFFLALQVDSFRELSSFREAVGTVTDRVRSSRPVDPERPVLAPGDLAIAARENAGEDCPIDLATLHSLSAIAQRLGVHFPFTASTSGEHNA
ncbi:hypothetical protein N185_32345 [Sinorhizobium sp. GW3]|nr:hypothetical protein N185_32345 [Sinorhizobium sp. GW3]